MDYCLVFSEQLVQPYPWRRSSTIYKNRNGGRGESIRSKIFTGKVLIYGQERKI
jgi:hypothetical protein